VDGEVRAVALALTCSDQPPHVACEMAWVRATYQAGVGWTRSLSWTPELAGLTSRSGLG
jgi:hypothetical protein